MNPSKPLAKPRKKPAEVPLSPRTGQDSGQPVQGDPVTGEVCTWCGRLLRVSEGFGPCNQCRDDGTKIERQLIENKV